MRVPSCRMERLNLFFHREKVLNDYPVSVYEYRLILSQESAFLFTSDFRQLKLNVWVQDRHFPNFLVMG